MFAYRSILREPPRPAVIRENPRAPWLAVGVVCFGAFMGQLDASIVAITFPAMQREFGAPVAAVQWVSLSYLLGLIAMLAPAGRLGDAVGRKLVYTYGFAAFTVASAACGLAPSLGVLVTLRLVQAVGAAAAAFIRREARTRHPLIPVRLLRSRPLAFGLAGAACGYLALFGPLVLIPQVLASGPGGAARTGLLLSALPVGFGLAALLGDLLLPKTWNDRRRGLAGALLTCAVMGASVVVPVNQATVVPQLALAGLGLGIFVPANNTVIMRGAADSSASLVGGLVSMARGIGTTFGISLMALAWHLGSHSYQAGNPGYSGSEQARPAFAVLAVVAATAAAIALASRTRPRQPAERPREGNSSGADH
jgi:MFS family permease